MKKVMLVIVALLIAAPAMADVTITAVGGTDCTFTITYAADGDDAIDGKSLISGMALNISVDGGATIDSVSEYKDDGESTNSSPGYGIYPGSILFDVNKEVTSHGDPVAPGGDPGAEGDLPSASCTIEVGALYNDDAEPSAAPLDAGTLCKFAVSGACNVSLALESTHRKGIVMEDGSAPSTINLVPGVVVPCGPPYPECWMDEIGGTQCHGNFGGPAYPDTGWAAVNSTDFLALKDAYLGEYGDLDPEKKPYNACADSNRDGYVNSTDFLALKEYYLDNPVIGGCENDGLTTWPPVL